MPRRPRIDMVGYYHVVNRGVEQRIVYEDSEDFDYFLELLQSGSMLYEVQVHAYALMDNHYHLLIETTKENLSKFMKHINAMYAIYFNKKYARSGHLWQGRFKSWFVTDEAYLYTLVAYIEHNPLKAGMIEVLGEYPYSSCYAFYELGTAAACLRGSFIFKEFPILQDRMDFLESAKYEVILNEIKKASNLVVSSIPDRSLDMESLLTEFKKVSTMSERNEFIAEAWKRGYSQHALASVVGVSQAQVNRIVKKQRV